MESELMESEVERLMLQVRSWLPDTLKDTR